MTDMIEAAELADMLVEDVKDCSPQHPRRIAFEQAAALLRQSASGVPSDGSSLCTFGEPAKRKPKYIIIFEDAEAHNLYFDDRDEAIKTFQRVTLNWNCTLFGTVDLQAAMTTPRETRR